MADLLTHGAAAVLVKAATRWRMAPVFVAGTLAPDMLSRAPAIGLGLIHRHIMELPPALTYGWDPMHQPIGMVLLAFFIAMLFAQDIRRTVFWNLLGGMALHLGVDMLQDHHGVGYLLAYPFSSFIFEFGWVGSEDSVYVAPLIAALAGWAVWKRGTKDNSGG